VFNSVAVLSSLTRDRVSFFCKILTLISKFEPAVHDYLKYNSFSKSAGVVLHDILNKKPLEIPVRAVFAVGVLIMPVPMSVIYATWPVKMNCIAHLFAITNVGASYFLTCGFCLSFFCMYSC